MSRVQFGAYTRKLRTTVGLSQLEVARSLGLKSGQLVSNWERGTCYPPLESFGELTSLYKVNLKSFFNKYWEHVKADDWKKIR